MTAGTSPGGETGLRLVGVVPETRGEETTYFDFCQKGELRIQRCRSCSAYVFYPRSACPSCMGFDLEWVQARGTGTVFSFTVQHREAPGFEGQAPYVLAIIELDEGVRMMSRVVADPDAVRVGMPVRVQFAAIAEDFRVPVFVPAERSDG